MLTCKQVSKEIASEELDAAWKRRLGVRSHLLMCRHCRGYSARRFHRGGTPEGAASPRGPAKWVPRRQVVPRARAAFSSGDSQFCPSSVACPSPGALAGRPIGRSARVTRGSFRSPARSGSQPRTEDWPVGWGECLILPPETPVVPPHVGVDLEAPVQVGRPQDVQDQTLHRR